MKKFSWFMIGFSMACFINASVMTWGPEKWHCFHKQHVIAKYKKVDNVCYNVRIVGDFVKLNIASTNGVIQIIWCDTNNR